MQIKVGASLYQFPERPLELGEQRLLKHEFKYVPGRDEFDPYDPDHLAAWLFAAMRQADPDASATALVSRVNRVREINIVGDDGEPLPVDDPEAVEGSQDPPPAGPVEAEEASS